MRRKIISLLVLFLLLVPSGICLADVAPAESALTVEQAIKLALANNNEVKSASLALDAATISNQMVWESTETALQPDANGVYWGGIDSWNAVYNSDYNLQAAQKNYDTKVESVKFAVYQKYYAVVSALDNNDVQRLASQQSEDQCKIALLRFELGMNTKLAVFQAQQQNVSAQSGLAGSSEALDQKYMALMEYIGRPKTDRPSLVRELTYTPFKLDNPETKIADIVKASPSVWLAKKSYTLTQDTTNISDDLSVELADVNLEKADLAIITTRDAMTQVTRNIYYSILSNEESYNTAIESAKAADEALRVATLLYDVGMGTKLDVTAAEIAAKNAHQAVDSLSYQHAILVMAFEKPWAYGGI